MADIATYQRLFNQVLIHELQTSKTIALHDSPHLAFFKKTLLNSDNTINEKAFWDTMEDAYPLLDMALQKELWTLKGYRCCPLEGHTRSICAVAISPNSLLVATGSNDTAVRLWSTATGKLLHNLEGHTKGISSLAFSPDSSIILTGSWDATACLWDTHTGNQLAVLPHKDGVWLTVFDISGTQVLIKTTDQEVHIWRIFCDAHKWIREKEAHMLWLWATYLTHHAMEEDKQDFFSMYFLQRIPQRVQDFLLTYVMHQRDSNKTNESSPL